MNIAIDPMLNALPCFIMCFSTSRFEARVNESLGELVALEHQDRTTKI